MFCVVFFISGLYHLYGSVVVLFLGNGLLQGVQNMGDVAFFQNCAIPAQLCSFFVLYKPIWLTYDCSIPLGAWIPGGWSRLLLISIFYCSLSLYLWLSLYNLHLYDCILYNVLKLCCHCYFSYLIYDLCIFHLVFVLFLLCIIYHICCMSVDIPHSLTDM